MKAVRVHNYGGPEVLKLDDIPIPEAETGRSAHKDRGQRDQLIDIYQRTGLYPLETPSLWAWNAPASSTRSVRGVTEVKNGDRVAYAMISGSLRNT